jgi:ParB/RepB/Spo0J family partition protein
LEQLKQSISSTTLIEPILIRENEAQQGRYLIVDGERRWRSCKELEFDAIECRILTKDSIDYELVSFSQNVHREDFTAMEKSLALENLFSKMRSEDNAVEQNALVSKVNLSKSYVSELMKISKLDQDIKDEALKSNFWTHSRLLQLAKIANHETRMNKFEEFKITIDKKQLKSDKTENEADEVTLPDATANSDDQSSSDDLTQNENLNKKILRFLSHANTFKSKLIQISKLKPETEAIDKIKPELNQIFDLINEILK